MPTTSPVSWRNRNASGTFHHHSQFCFPLWPVLALGVSVPAGSWGYSSSPTTDLMAQPLWAARGVSCRQPARHHRRRLPACHTVLLPAALSHCSGGKGEGHFPLCEPFHRSAAVDFPLVHLGGRSQPFSTLPLFSYHKQRRIILMAFKGWFIRQTGIFYCVDFTLREYL